MATSMPIPSVFAPASAAPPPPPPSPPATGAVPPHPANRGGSDALSQAHSVYASVLRHLLCLRPAQHPRDATSFTALVDLVLCPDPNGNGQCYSKATQPMSLHVIEHNVRAHSYASPAAFETDILQLFANARQANKAASQTYGQIIRLQHIYLELVNWPCADTVEAIEAHMDAVVHLASLQPTPFVSVPVGPGEASISPAHRGMDMPPPGTADSIQHARLSNREKVVLDHAEFKGQTYRVGDWVHLINPSNPAKPIVGQIFKVLQKVPASSNPSSARGIFAPGASSPTPLPTATGQYYVSVCWYYRPEETVHSASRRFIPNEVFKTGTMVDHKIQDIVERCFVMFYTRFIRGRPTAAVWNSATEQLYVSEFRYNDLTRQFTKIKSWNSCIPEELRGGEVPMDAFSKAILPERKPSPFVLGTADGPGFLIPENPGHPPPTETHVFMSRKRPAAEPVLDMRPRKEAAMRSRRAPPPSPLQGFPQEGNFFCPSPSSHPMVMMPPPQHAPMPLAIPHTVGLSPSPPVAEVAYRPGSAGGAMNMGVNFGIPQLFPPDMFFSRGGEIRSPIVQEPVPPVPMANNHGNNNDNNNNNNSNWLTAPVQRVRHSSVPVDADRSGFLSPLMVPQVSSPGPSMATAPVSPLPMESPVRIFFSSAPVPGRAAGLAPGSAPALTMTPPSNIETPGPPLSQPSTQYQLIPELTFDSAGSTLGDVSSASSTWPMPGSPVPPPQLGAVHNELSPALSASPFWTEAPAPAQEANAQVLRRPSFDTSHSLASFHKELAAENTPPSSEDGRVCAKASEAPSAGVLSPLDKLFPLPPDAALERLFPLEELAD